ncbi:MAG: hypothetical protein WAU68_07460 [Vitreimonas sp.]
MTDELRDILRRNPTAMWYSESVSRQTLEAVRMPASPAGRERSQPQPTTEPTADQSDKD